MYLCSCYHPEDGHMSGWNVDNYYNKVIFINPSVFIGSFKNFIRLVNARIMNILSTGCSQNGLSSKVFFHSCLTPCKHKYIISIQWAPRFPILRGLFTLQLWGYRFLPAWINRVRRLMKMILKFIHWRPVDTCHQKEE